LSYESSPEVAQLVIQGLAPKVSDQNPTAVHLRPSEVVRHVYARIAERPCGEKARKRLVKVK